jgi:two-component system, chemotaxis family, sensor kinase CheA
LSGKGGPGDRATEKAREEFLAEAQENVELLSRDLVRLDEGRAQGRFDPEVLNEAFRAVHSLKGLSGLFGMAQMGELSHHLENLLDALRLGRAELTPETLDLLFESVTAFHQLIRATAEPEVGTELGDLTDLAARLDAAGATSGTQQKDVLAVYALDPGLLSVLTEYEEHRLRQNVTEGRALYRVRATFALETIDKGLEDVKNALRPLGEAIAFLPSADGTNPTEIDLDILFGSTASAVNIAAVLGGRRCTVAAIPRNEAVAPERPPPEPGPALAREAEEPIESSLRSVAQTVRVDIRKLDALMNLVGELGNVRAGLDEVLDVLRQQRTALPVARSMHREMRALERKLDELQAGVLDIRMVPLGQVFDKLSRVVRKLSRDAGKEIRLVIQGGDTELDKLIVEELSDPLMHVIRNAIDHGIEPPAARRAAGKPEAGTISVVAEQRGSHVMIDISDDGAGLDGERLAEKAIERGILAASEAEALSEREIHNLIFLPGVSTKRVADQISGRGVGMDVVKTNIARLSGIIDVTSEKGRGTRLSIQLPVTLAIVQALVVRAAGRTYCIPLNSVLESLRIGTDEIAVLSRREVMTLRGHTLPLVRIERLFELQADRPAPRRCFVVVVGLAQHRIGLVVDELIGQEDIVVKPLGAALDGTPGVAGATELGGKRTVLVLDVAAIVDESTATRVEAA